MKKSIISKISTQTLGALSLRVIENVNNSGITEAINSSVFQSLITLNNEYQTSLAPVNIKVLSAEVNEKYDERNSSFKKLKDYISGMLNSDSDEVSAAAKKVYAVITMYGTNFSNLKKTDRTLRYIRIIETLKSDDYADALEKTSITERVNTLDTLQREYETVYMSKGSKVASQTAPSNIRKSLETGLKNLIDAFEVFQNQYQTDAWTTLYADLVKRVEEVSSSIQTKSTKTVESTAPVAADTTVQTAEAS